MAKAAKPTQWRVRSSNATFSAAQISGEKNAIKTNSDQPEKDLDRPDMGIVAS